MAAMNAYSLRPSAPRQASCPSHVCDAALPRQAEDLRGEEVIVCVTIDRRARPVVDDVINGDRVQVVLHGEAKQTKAVEAPHGVDMDPPDSPVGSKCILRRVGCVLQVHTNAKEEILNVHNWMLHTAQVIVEVAASDRVVRHAKIVTPLEDPRGGREELCQAQAPQHNVEFRDDDSAGLIFTAFDPVPTHMSDHLFGTIKPYLEALGCKSILELHEVYVRVVVGIKFLKDLLDAASSDIAEVTDSGLVEASLLCIGRTRALLDPLAPEGSIANLIVAIGLNFSISVPQGTAHTSGRLA